MSGFNSTSGDLERVFFTTSELMDRFVGVGLWSWGSNASGQLGDNTTSNRSSPVSPVSGLNIWKDVSGGNFHTIAIKTDGTLWTWGQNASGELGTNNTSSRSSPAQTVSSGTTWLQASGGNQMSAAIKTDGTLWTWGLNTSGQLGDGTTSNRSSPVTISGGGTNWKQVACAGSSLALKTDGTLWAWGLNANGQLGDGTTSGRSSPVTTVSGGTNWKQAACGYQFSAAIKTDGTLWAWGSNQAGQLGTGNTSSYSSPVTTTGGGTTWKQVACGYRHAIAIKTDGTLWTWGLNTSGQLGDGTTSNRSSPVTISGGGTTWKQAGVSGINAGANSSAAVKTDGTLWTWGVGTQGVLGDNTTSNRSSPINPVGGFTNWLKVVTTSRTYGLAQL